MIDCISWNCWQWSLIFHLNPNLLHQIFASLCDWHCLLSFVTIDKHQGRLRVVIKVSNVQWQRFQEFCEGASDHPLRGRSAKEKEMGTPWKSQKKKMEKLATNSMCTPWKEGEMRRRWRNLRKVQNLFSSCFSPLRCLSPWSEHIVRRDAGWLLSLCFLVWILKLSGWSLSLC